MAKPKLAVIACGAIAHHLLNISTQNKIELTIFPLPPLLHNRPEQIAGAVEEKYHEIKDDYQRIAIAYADCGTYGALDQIINRYGLPRLAGNHCYDLFAGEVRVNQLTSSGTYLLTDYLVKSFHRSVIVELGLDRHPELIDDYFKNYQKVTWLAQQPSDELSIAAQAAADFMKLPLEIETVGETGLLNELQRLLDDLR